MAVTTNLLSSFSLSTVATSPTLTISGIVTTVSYNLSIVVPVATSGTLTLEFERSLNGVAWTTFNLVQLVGGLISRGPNIGSQATELIAGEIANLNVGDKLRVVASGVSGTWILTASITQS